MYNGKIISMSMTTCKRKNLFKIALDSILECFEDLNLIDNFFLVDDSSSQEDREWMEQYCKLKINVPLNFLFQDKKGLQFSLRMLYEELKNHNTVYSLHFEDDWRFFKKAPYITQALKLIDNLDNIEQVCFTTYTHYLDPKDPYRLYGLSGPTHELKGIKYHLPEKKNWTTSPHLMNYKKVYETIGSYPLDEGRSHELVYRVLYLAKGMRNAFLAGHFVDNIADTSAYELNRTDL